MASLKKRAPDSPPAPIAPAPPRRSPFSSHLFIALGLCLLSLLAYSNSFHDGFTLDSAQLILHDARIQQATAGNVDQILHHTYWWPYGESGLYRPLSTLSYLFNYAVLGNGEHGAGYHWINLLLHLCNVLLVYALSLRLIGTRGRAAAVAALWAVHPVLTESVTCVTGRPDLLAAIGVLGGFLLYLVSVESTGRRRWAALAGVAAVTAIGVFSKESAVTVLGVMAVYELTWWTERRQARGRVAGFAAAAIPIAAMLYQRAQVLAASSPANFPFLDNPITSAGFVQGRLTAIAILARYLWRLVCPITLSADYSYEQIPLSSGTVTDWVSWLVVAALAVLVYRSYRWNRTAFFFAGFAAATILPTSNLLFPIGTIMGERFLYLPAFAFCACLVLCYGAIPPRLRAAAPWIVGLLVAACAVRTWLRNPDWQDDLHMAQAMVKTSPNSYKVRKTLALRLFYADPTHGNLDQVLAQAEQGLVILDHVPNADNSADAYRWTAGYYYTKGDLLRRADASGKLVSPPDGLQAFHRAVELLNRALEIMGWAGQDFRAKAAAYERDVNVGAACRALSQSYDGLDDPQAAYDAASRAVAADPLNADSYLQLSRVLVRAGQLEGAATALLQGSTLAPGKRITDELAKVFRSGLDPQSCALKQVGQGYALNPACEPVRRLLCPALSNAAAIRMQTGRPDLAAQLSSREMPAYGCLASPDPARR